MAADKVGLFGLSLGSIVAMYIATESTDIEVMGHMMHDGNVT